MLHKALSDYMELVERLVLRFPDLYVDYYLHEVISYERGQHSFQDEDNRMIFRYDSTPHHPNIWSFPHHKHLPDTVVLSAKPDIEQVVEETVIALHH